MIGWHTGAIAKVVLVIGLAVIALHLLHQAGIELPATVPESLVVIVLGSLATVLVLIRVITIPEEFQPASRGIGLWISLLAAHRRDRRGAPTGFRGALTSPRNGLRPFRR